jgi:ketosteroid isomerase-like protein
MKKKIYFIWHVSFILLIGITCNAQGNKIESIEALARQQGEAWNGLDSIKYASLYSDDFIFEDMAFGTVISGDKNKLIRMFQGTVQAVPDLRFETTSISANDSMVFAE